MEPVQKRFKSQYPLPYIEKCGDITESYNFNSVTIVQINNCISRKLHPHSFTWNLSCTFPYANPYSSRRSEPYPNLADIYLLPQPGTVKLALSPPACNGPTIACCFSQYRMGNVDSAYYINCKKVDEEYRIMSFTKDTYPHRLDYFNKSLNVLCDKLKYMFHINIIVFPKYIGCGLAGGFV